MDFEFGKTQWLNAVNEALLNPSFIKSDFNRMFNSRLTSSHANARLSESPVTIPVTIRTSLVCPATSLGTRLVTFPVTNAVTNLLD